MDRESVFTVEKDRTCLPGGSSLILNIPIEPISVYGRLKTLFGDSDAITSDYENLYSYILRTEDGNGDPVWIEAYFGPSGPAIGGNQDRESLIAARRLVSLLEETEPADYEIRGFYEDVMMKITMGIEDKVPYMKSRPAVLEPFIRMIGRFLFGGRE